MNDAEIDALVEANRVKGYLIVFDLPDPTRGKTSDKIVPGPTEAPPGKVPGCWLGGKPTLPADLPWPYYHSPYHKTDVPMVFIGQVDCAQLPVIEGRPEIPRSGTLFFFYDPIYDYEHMGAGKVFYVDDDVSNLPYREAPKLPSDFDWQAIEDSGYLMAEPDWPRVMPKYTFTPIRYDEFNMITGLSGGDDRAYIHAFEKLKGPQEEEIARIINERDGQHADVHETWKYENLVATLFGAIVTLTCPTRKKQSEKMCIARFCATPRLIGGFSMGYSLNVVMNNEDLAPRRFDKTSWEQ